jgi:hypothetical protein
MSMMEEPWEEHQSWRDRLAEPETLIPILQRERRLIRKSLDALKYPVLKLPGEVTAEIFLLCVPPIRYTDGRNFRGPASMAQVPLLLLRACRAWRDIISVDNAAAVGFDYRS